jgi:transporter family protein
VGTMEKWVVYAFVSMLFAGVTSVIAKLGLAGISGDLGLAIRTCFVFAFVAVFAIAVVPRGELAALSMQNLWWLALSALTTTVSWVFYYRAIKAGEVSTVALIDKGSVIVAVVLAWLLLRETLTPNKLIGAALIVSGLVVIARR